MSLFNRQQVWPFPPPTGPVPWTPAQDVAYKRKQLNDAEDAPW